MIAVIGIGSPFGADQLGWRVIDYLQQSEVPKSKSANAVVFNKLDRPGSGVIDQLQHADAAILIDAICSNLYAEHQVVVMRVDELLNLLDDQHNSIKLLSSHDFGLLEAIQLAKSLNVLPEETILLGFNLATFKKIENSDDRYIVPQEQVQLLANSVRQLLQTL